MQYKQYAIARHIGVEQVFERRVVQTEIGVTHYEWVRSASYARTVSTLPLAEAVWLPNGNLAYAIYNGRPVLSK